LTQPSWSGGRLTACAREETPEWITIVGVVGDVHHFGLATGEQPAIYTPYAQSAQSWKRWTEIVVRGPGASLGLAELVRRKIRSVDPLLPIARLRTMDQVVGESLTRQRFNAELLSIFAAAALGLACVGIFGVMFAMISVLWKDIIVAVNISEATFGRILAAMPVAGVPAAGPLPSGLPPSGTSRLKCLTAS